MFNVTLVNLSPDARTATVGGGPRDIGQTTASELITLLTTFAEIDPVQNNDADPEIRVQVRRGRFVIRTAQRKLFLQNSRNLAEPAYTLTPTEIIEELDGTAEARRTVPPIAPAFVSNSSPGFAVSPEETVSIPVREPESRPWPVGLIALVLLLGGYIAYAEIARQPGESQPALAPLTSAERVAEDSALTGVYVTGSEPGQHGIVILGDGKLKIFQINAQAAPGTVYGTYRLGRLDGKVCLTTDLSGGLIKVLGREALEFCGETYKRVP